MSRILPIWVPAREKQGENMPEMSKNQEISGKNPYKFAFLLNIADSVSCL
jgi:hypothetical protein